MKVCLRQGTLLVGNFAGCCARAEVGHAVTAPTSPINSRRLIRPPVPTILRIYQDFASSDHDNCCAALGVGVAGSATGQEHVCPLPARTGTYLCKNRCAA